MPASPRASNPARLLEQVAIEVVSRWVGNLGTVIDTSTGHGPDFRIEYDDGRTGLGEVGWHQDPELQATWAAVLQRPRHQVIELARGSGSWYLQIMKGTNIRQLYAMVPDFVDFLRALGHTAVTPSESWWRGEPVATANRLGISHIELFDSGGPDQAAFFIEGKGGVTPPNTDSVPSWVDDVLRDPVYADTTGKLLPLDASERHVFLFSGGLTSYEVDEALRLLGTVVPSDPPHPPEGITHIWVMSQYRGYEAALWSLMNGWVAVPLLPQME